MSKSAILLFPCFLLAGVIASAQSANESHRQNAGKAASSTIGARNVILLIGDGMGYSEMTIARNYYYGAAGRLEMDALPYTGSLATYSLIEKDPSKPDYVTDSAAGATAWATGVKTSNGRLATAPQTNAVLKTILEMAREKGFKTGNVTTAELVDATPAALASHISWRRCYGPAEMRECLKEKKSEGGLGSIAEQMVEHNTDVMLGGGRKRFQGIIDGGQYANKTVLEEAEQLGYQIVNTSAELGALQPGPRKVLGLFNDANMSLEWSGDPAIPYPGSGPQTCQEFVRPLNEPGLPFMTLKAIQLLQREGSGPGFFLQVEGAQIDKRAHYANPCEQIGETIAFDNAIKIALDFARARKDTLVIVTSDHSHTSQIVPIPTPEEHPAGLVSTLITADKTNMAINYATTSVCCSRDHDMQHTGAQVRVAAFGPMAEQVLGHHDMTDIYHLMAQAMGLEH
jgi:alkaline phosphatase